MTSQPLDNYLLAYRKTAGLSQDDVAYLLGSRSGTKIARYERRSRVPLLDTALAYEAVFGTPVRTLFAGRSHNIERKVGRRVKDLLRKVERGKHDRLTGRKLEMLRAIAAGGAARLPRHV